MLVSEILQTRFRDRFEKMLRSNEFGVKRTVSEQKKFNFDLAGVIETGERLGKQIEIEKNMEVFYV